MIKKIRLSLLITALILFFLPWITVKCQDATLVTQSGFESTYGGVTLSDSMKELASKRVNKDNPEKDKATTDGSDVAPFTAAALLFTLLAVASSVISLRRKTCDGKDFASILSGVALALLVIQMVVGFPVTSMSEKNKSSTEDDRIMASSMKMAMNIRTEYTMFYYLELLALATPVILMVGGSARKNEESEV